ncbi:hypothetical protein [Holophaga foetida]|uniref:hypothetical protein n=1 Tax=Holophaga foetida TaxID=35839 RepID=UPI00047E83A5|nr:hypothetical protein [Holophaga foetida]
MPERFFHVGGIFLRWDYLLLLPAAFIWLYSCTFKIGQTEFRYNLSRMESLLIFLIAMFGIMALLRIPSNYPDFGEAVKYAIWPWKMLIWAMLIRELVVRTLDWDRDLLRSLLTLTFLIFFIQVMELTNSSFRSLLLDLYPMSAPDRIQELSYRARAIFSGYDVTSMFFCGMAIIFYHALQRDCRINPNVLRLAIVFSAIGAFLAARTGFLLLGFYLFLKLICRLGHTKKLLLVITLVVTGSVAHFLPDDVWREGSLMGRYFEVLKIFKRGNPMDVQSFYGTVYMNLSVFFLNPWEPWLGAGLDIKTTADQLYAKYLFMFGSIGLAFWSLIHGLMTWVCARASQDQRWPTATRTYAHSLYHISMLTFIAHLKGGNYFFAHRLGDYWFLLLFVVISMRHLPLHHEVADADT